MSRLLHPIEFIDEELEARGWTRRELAERIASAINVHRSGKDVDVQECAMELYALRDPRISLDEESAVALGKVFGTSTELWLNADRAWREDQEQEASR